MASQGYVAFFGGPIAATLIGLVNGWRLGVSASRLALLAAGGVLALAVSLLVVIGVGPSAFFLGPRIVGVVFFVACARPLQAQADRVHHFFDAGEESYASLVPPGIAAALVGIVGESYLLSALGRGLG